MPKKSSNGHGKGTRQNGNYSGRVDATNLRNIEREQLVELKQQNRLLESEKEVALNKLADLVEERDQAVQKQRNSPKNATRR